MHQSLNVYHLNVAAVFYFVKTSGFKESLGPKFNYSSSCLLQSVCPFFFHRTFFDNVQAALFSTVKVNGDYRFSTNFLQWIIFSFFTHKDIGWLEDLDYSTSVIWNDHIMLLSFVLFFLPFSSHMSLYLKKSSMNIL